MFTITIVCIVSVVFSDNDLDYLDELLKSLQEKELFRKLLDNFSEPLMIVEND